MGKGTIVSGGTDGSYQVTLNYDRTQAEAEVVELAARTVDLLAKISTETDPLAKARMELQVASNTKRTQFLGQNIPPDPTVQAWCADLTEDAAGTVGTIEVPGEESGSVLIQPGGAAWDSERDGLLVPLLAQSAAQVWNNMGLTPGWQKWQPTFRFGVITALDTGADTADVDLDAAISSQQNLDVNQTDTLVDVPIDYLTCGAAAFTVGSQVLVEFTDQDWEQPVIIGFKTSPQPCALCTSVSNLVPNGCMELTGNWTPDPGNDPGEDGRSAVEVFQGDFSRRVEVYPGAIPLSPEYGIHSDSFVVSSGTDYIMSSAIWVDNVIFLGTDVQYHVAILLYNLDMSAPTFALFFDFLPAGSTDQWIEFEGGFSGNLSPGNNQVRLQLREAGPIAPSLLGFTAYWDNISVIPV